MEREEQKTDERSDRGDAAQPHNGSASSHLEEAEQEKKQQCSIRNKGITFKEPVEKEETNRLQSVCLSVPYRSGTPRQAWAEHRKLRDAQESSKSVVRLSRRCGLLGSRLSCHDEKEAAVPLGNTWASYLSENTSERQCLKQAVTPGPHAAH